MPMKTTPDNPLALIADAWKYAPHQAVSLWDMILFSTCEFLLPFELLEGAQRDAADKAKQYGLGWDASDEFIADLKNPLRKMMEICRKLEMNSPVDRMADFLVTLALPHKHLCSAIAQELDGVLRAIQMDFATRRLVFIPKDRLGFFERSKLFGDEVCATFPEAAQDIKEAGNCLAADLNTAAVFHLMRVAELGLRALVSDINSGFVLNSPIEFATWGQVADMIIDKLKAIKATPKGDAREEDIQFYSSLLVDMRAFQYAWRDPVMHCRTRFDEPKQAENVLNHVRRFMETLAKRLSPV